MKENNDLNGLFREADRFMEVDKEKRERTLERLHSAYEEINESHTGTSEDPIPYNNNMELVEGKYYSQDGVTYLCTRSTGQAVYNPLKDLVGIYVEVHVNI